MITPNSVVYLSHQQRAGTAMLDIQYIQPKYTAGQNAVVAAVAAVNATAVLYYIALLAWGEGAASVAWLIWQGV